MQLEELPMGYKTSGGSPQPIASPQSHTRSDSAAKLLTMPNTPNTATWRNPQTPQRSSTEKAPIDEWWHHRPAWFMYVSFFCGVIFAICHHLFYKYLDGKYADEQVAMLRYGTVLSFAAKAGLVAGVVIAFKQRIWTTVRNKFLTLAALDSLFAATEDATAFLNLDIYKSAKVAVLLAAYIWATPLVVILTSNTLSVVPALRLDNTTCQGIRTLNFTHDELEEWREPTRINGLNGLSISIWNTTSMDVAAPDWFDYYTGSSNSLIRIATQAALTGRPVSRIEANEDICGSDWDCTYVVNFTAPAYKCTELARGVGSHIKPLGGQQPPRGLDTKLLLPEGNYSYYAYTNGGDYAPEQLKGSGIGGIPNIDPPYPQTFGAFRTEPVIWIGYSERTHPNETAPQNRSMPGWNDAFIPKIIGCEHYEAEYTVLFNLTGGHQFTNVLKRKYLNRVMETNWVQGDDANDGTNDNTTAYPKQNYVYPRDLYKYRRVATYHSMGAQLRGFLNGTINSAQLNTPIEVTRADQTRLLDQRKDFFAVEDLPNAIQDFYQDMILSLFSNQQFVSVVWAAKPHVKPGANVGDASTMYPCVKSRTENRYAYRERDLWLVYSFAIALAAAGVAAGTMSILENEGVIRSTRFSSIVAATRGPALEKLGWVGSHRSGDLPNEMKNMKVGFGVAHRPNDPVVSQEGAGHHGREAQDAEELHYCFGLEGDIRQRKPTRIGSNMFRQQ